MDEFKWRWRQVAHYPVAFGRSRVSWTGVVLAMVLAQPALEHAGWASSGATNHAVAGGATAQLDPLAAFGLRSPGARGSGAMLQTKNRMAAIAKGKTPHERVLSNIRYAPPGLISPNLLNDIVPSDLPSLYSSPPMVPGPGFPVATIGFPGGPVYSGSPPGGGGGGGGPGGPGGPSGPSGPGVPSGPGGPTSPSGPSTLPPGLPALPPGPPTLPPGLPGLPGLPSLPPGPPILPPVVPEPSTWAMLMLGMFLVGSGLRSVQRRLAQAQAPGDDEPGATTAATGD